MTDGLVMVRGPARLVKTLKDGYWDRTEVVEHGDGSLRVRKTSKGDAPPGPWGVAALRKEIAYLSTLPKRAAGAFPPVLAAWDDGSATCAHVGYEVPFYAAHLDAGRLAREGALEQAEIDEFQDTLADVVFERLHVPSTSRGEPLSAHVRTVVEQAFCALESQPELARPIRGNALRLNGEQQLGARAAFVRALDDVALLAALDAGPQVRLHGDLFLENVLWLRNDQGSASRLLLIDPVSVAGVVEGPPLFDLVKYESYATGELLALRSEWMDVGGFDGRDEYTNQVRWQHEQLRPFRRFDWHTRFRRAFEAKYGAVHRRARHLIDGYFSVAMAVNTGGLQRRARLLKAVSDFNLAAG